MSHVLQKYPVEEEWYGMVVAPDLADGEQVNDVTSSGLGVAADAIAGDTNPPEITTISFNTVNVEVDGTTYTPGQVIQFFVKKGTAGYTYTIRATYKTTLSPNKKQAVGILEMLS